MVYGIRVAKTGLAARSLFLVVLSWNSWALAQDASDSSPAAPQAGTGSSSQEPKPLLSQPVQEGGKEDLATPGVGGDDLPAESKEWPQTKVLEAKVARAFGDPPGMKRIAKDGRVWIDPKNKRIVVDGYVAMRMGQLEMFACPAGTKEHESLVGLLTKAQYVHAGLLAVGAKPGSPVKFDPKYEIATGSRIGIEILYKDADGKKHRVPGKSWVRQAGTQKELEMDWVFAGSGMWKDPDSGEELYLAEQGDLICVSNFTTATLDLPIRSSQANSSLMFSAFTDRMPPEQTPVRLVLTVLPEKPEHGKGEPESDK